MAIPTANVSDYAAYAAAKASQPDVFPMEFVEPKRKRGRPKGSRTKNKKKRRKKDAIAEVEYRQLVMGADALKKGVRNLAARIASLDKRLEELGTLYSKNTLSEFKDMTNFLRQWMEVSTKNYEHLVTQVQLKRRKKTL